jgi:hypothetical protein
MNVALCTFFCAQRRIHTVPGKSYFAPFTSSGVVFWGLLVFFAIVVVTILALIYMRVTGREEWMDKAQLVFEQSGSSH